MALSVKPKIKKHQKSYARPKNKENYSNGKNLNGRRPGPVTSDRVISSQVKILSKIVIFDFGRSFHIGSFQLRSFRVGWFWVYGCPLQKNTSNYFYLLNIKKGEIVNNYL